MLFFSWFVIHNWFSRLPIDRIGFWLQQGDFELILGLWRRGFEKKKRKVFDYESLGCELFEVQYIGRHSMAHTVKLTPSDAAKLVLIGSFTMTACIGLPACSRTIVLRTNFYFLNNLSAFPCWGSDQASDGISFGVITMLSYVNTIVSHSIYSMEYIYFFLVYMNID